MKLANHLIALAAALSLAACGDTDEAEYAESAGTEETTVVTQEVPAEAPAENNTASQDEGSQLTIDGRDVDATISKEGVKADIKVDERD